MSIEIVLKGKPDDATQELLIRMLGKLVSIEERLTTIEEKIMGMEEVIVALTEEVSQMGTVVEGVVTVIDAFIARVEAAKDDPAQVQAAVDAFKAQRTVLADAVARGTLAAAEVPPGGTV